MPSIQLAGTGLVGSRNHVTRNRSRRAGVAASIERWAISTTASAHDTLV